MSSERHSSEIVTVVICTRNRAGFLKRCLDGLQTANAKMQLPVIVVDNGSSDETKEVVSFYGCRLICEPEVGLSHARNAGLDAVSTEYVVYLDDDAIPGIEWCDSIIEGIQHYRPDVFGGPYIPYYLESKPNWFLDEFASAHLELEEGEVPAEECFSGGNMGWRVALLREMGGFDPKLGMCGSRMALGEETALQIEMQKNPKIKRCFFSGMLMEHYVHPQKMKVSYIAKRSFQYGIQLRDINPVDPILTSSSWFGLLIRARFGLPIMARLVLRDRERSPCWRTFLARYFASHGIEVGVLWRRLFG